MILPTAAGDGVFFKSPPTGRGLAGVENSARGFREPYPRIARSKSPRRKGAGRNSAPRALRSRWRGPGRRFSVRFSRLTIRCPSRESFSILIFGESSRNAASAKSSPATTSGSRARMTAPAVAVSGTIASVVVSPPPMSSARAARTAWRISAADNSTRET